MIVPGLAPTGAPLSGVALGRVRGMPGLAPAGDSLSLASPRESKQREGGPTVCVPTLRCGQPALLSKRGRYANSLRSNTRLADPRFTALLGAYRGAAIRTTKFKQGRAMARPCGLGCSDFECLDFAVLAELSSAAAGGSGRALFERSEFSPTPTDASSARDRAAALTAAAFSFGYFSLGKQRTVPRQPGRDPACRAHLGAHPGQRAAASPNPGSRHHLSTPSEN